MKALSKMWHKMSVEEKKPYVDAYEGDQMRYLREMKEYELKLDKATVERSSLEEES